MRIKEGEFAPHFDVTDVFGKKYNLHDFVGKPILLSFLRSADCAFCNLRLHELMAESENFENEGLKTVVFFTSPAENILSDAKKQHIPFPVIPDPDLEIYKMYGVEESYSAGLRAMLRIGSLIKIMAKGLANTKPLGPPIVPADFLLDRYGRIQMSYYGRDFGDHSAVSYIKSVIPDLKKMAV